MKARNIPVTLTFLALASESLLAQNAQSPTTGNWNISETTSPLDYSPVVIAINRSKVGPTDSAMQLAIYCRNGRTSLAVSGSNMLSRGNDYTVSFINGAAPPAAAARAQSTATGAELRGDVVHLLQSFPDDGDVIVRLVSPSALPLMGVFALGGLKIVRAKLGAACNWPPAPTRPRN
jgi:hypothetical protein